jgi:hypothetical protein
MKRLLLILLVTVPVFAQRIPKIRNYIELPAKPAYGETTAWHNDTLWIWTGNGWNYTTDEYETYDPNSFGGGAPDSAIYAPTARLRDSLAKHQAQFTAAVNGKQAAGTYLTPTDSGTTFYSRTRADQLLATKQAGIANLADTSKYVETGGPASVPTGGATGQVLKKIDAAGGSSYTLVAKLAGDQATGANTTPVTLSGLVFTFAANSTYRVHFYGGVAPAAATTGCGFQFDVSAAVTSIYVQFTHQLAAAGTLTGGSSIADDASAGVSSGMPTTAVWPVTGEGIIITGANVGTAQLRFRSETTAITTCKAGFTLVVEKIL